MIALSLALFTPDAAACGGFFCNNVDPVKQKGETVVFEVDKTANRTTMHVQVEFQGPASEFAWVIPVRGEPDLALSNDALFTQLESRTRPQFNVQYDYGHGTCGWFWGDVDLDANGSAPPPQAGGGVGQGSVVGHGGAHDDNIAFRGACLAGFSHFRSTGDVRSGDPWPCQFQIHRAGNQFHHRPAQCGFLGQGEAHLATGAVPDEPDWVDRFLGRTGCDQDPFAIELALPDQVAMKACQDRIRFRHPAFSAEPAGQFPAIRTDGAHAAITQ